jgi:hypothetical protein
MHQLQVRGIWDNEQSTTYRPLHDFRTLDEAANYFDAYVAPRVLERYDVSAWFRIVETGGAQECPTWADM